MKATLVYAAAFLTAVGCSQDDDGSALTVRDSAAIQIVENAAPAWNSNEGWRLSSQPILSFGEAEEDSSYQFYEIVDVVLLSDSTVVVAAAGSNSLRFFDKTGRLIREVGRSGEGPGEFRALQNLRRFANDSLLVLDRSLQRITIFDRGGNVSRVVQLPIRSVSVYPLAEGKVLASEEEGSFGARIREDASPGLHRFPAAVVILSPDGSMIDTLGSFPGAELGYFKRGNRVSGLQAAYGRVLALAGRQSQIYVGTGDELRYDVYSDRGQHLRSVRAKGPDRTLSPSEVTTLHDRILDNVSNAAARERFASSLKAAPVPEQKAAFTRLLVDALDHIWLSDYENSFVSSGVWRVFSPEGRYLGEVHTPPDFRIRDVGEGYVAGVWKDDMGVESVRVYGLSR